MQLGSWEGITIHHFGILCRDYNLEIVTKLLLWISLAIPTLLKNCPFLSLKPQAWFAFLLEFSFIYNGKWSRELLVHLCPVLWRCKVFLEAAWYSCSYSPQAKESNICSPQPALSRAFKELSLPFCSHKATGRQFWLKTDSRTQFMESPECVWQFPQLLYFNAQWEPYLSGIVPCLSFLFSIFHCVFILTNSFPNVHHV